MKINVIWDASVFSAPSAFRAAILYVVNLFDQLFTNPITINIRVGWGEIAGQALVPGALGESEDFGNFLSYSQVRNALIGDSHSPDQMAADSTLPATDPTGGGTFFVPTAEEKALGLLPANGTNLDGYVGFARNAPWDFSTTNRAVPGQYDFIGVAEHEISEVLGRIAGLDPSFGFTPMDLFRYQAPNTRDLSGFPSSGISYFSINGGTTDLGDFNTDPNGDFGDWAADMAPDASLAFSSSGAKNDLTSVDIRVLNVLGYNVVSSSPPPVTYSITPNPATVNENAGTLTFTITRSDTSSAATVFASTETNQGFANNNNYTNIAAQPVNFAAGQSTATVTVSINDLGLTSGSETYGFIVQQNATDPPTTFLASDTFTIVNNDTAPPPVTYSITPNPASVNENAGTLTFTITRSDSSAAATIYASTETNQGFANNNNYTSVNAQPVTFAMGQSVATVTVSINDLGLTSGSEKYGFIVQQNATDPVTTFLASDTFTIVNNDTGPPPPTTYTITPNPAKVNQSAGTLTLTITRSDTSTAVTVYASTEQNQGFTNPFGKYYSNITDRAVSFAVGQATAKVSILLHNNGQTSGTETFGFIVQQNTSDPVSTFLASDTFTIYNANNAPSAALSAASSAAMFLGMSPLGDTSWVPIASSNVPPLISEGLRQDVLRFASPGAPLSHALSSVFKPPASLSTHFVTPT